MKNYQLRLDTNLTDDYKILRQDTTKPYTRGKHTYPVVYMQGNDFATLSLEYQGQSKLTLALNLQNYYVFGFIIDDKCYSFKGNDERLRQAGFDVEAVIPYGDAYFEIGKGGVEQKVCSQFVAKQDIITAIEFISDLNNGWEDKRPHILQLFWCLIEGIRFNGISDIVQNLLNDNTETLTYRYFFYMAERWEKISIGNAYLGKQDKSIAVYDLRPLEK